MSAPSEGLLQPAASKSIERDPRAKVLVGFLLVLTISGLPIGSWVEYGLVYALCLALAAYAGVRWIWLWRRSLLALPFLLAALTLPFVVPGTTWFELPLLGLPLSVPGSLRGFSLLLRSWIAIQIFLLLMALISIQDFFWALESLRVPALLVSIMSFTYRYLFVMKEETQRMVSARQARQTQGAARPGLRARLAYAGGFIGSLLLRGLGRSERVYSAMLARGYDGTVKTMKGYRWQLADSLTLLAALAFCGTLVLSSYALP
ncbi:MAG: cobalt ECF transporter T component CbiQ [Anaerolineales bacterium]